MDDLFEKFIEFKKFYLRGLDYAKEMIRLEDFIEDEQDRLELGNDPEEDLIFRFHDIEPEYQTALLFGYASGLVDILNALPKNKVRKAIAKVFHSEEMEEE